MKKPKMKTHPSWQYDEFKQVGKDFGSPMEVEVYDSSHADFRDLEAESSNSASQNGGLSSVQ